MNKKEQLDHQLSLSRTKNIHSNLERVWDVITTPKYIKEYLYGTDVISDWQEGSSLIFKGEWEGKMYEEKGTILTLQAPVTFKYSYFTPLFGLPDLPENYSIIENKLVGKDGLVTLHLTQVGFTSVDKVKHSEESWNQCLDIIKRIAERM
ncbi:SRPBCC domain-containing protein [Leptospira sp. 96542]|nr:SRPBCC domain-containing protein [Leptospira sp. 96542]